MGYQRKAFELTLIVHFVGVSMIMGQLLQSYSKDPGEFELPGLPYLLRFSNDTVKNAPLTTVYGTSAVMITAVFALLVCRLVKKLGSCTEESEIDHNRMVADSLVHAMKARSEVVAKRQEVLTDSDSNLSVVLLGDDHFQSQVDGRNEGLSALLRNYSV